MEMPSNEILLKLYRELLTARRGEQRMYEISGPRIFPTGHRGPGEEVIPIAICNNLLAGKRDHGKQQHPG